ncbi:uncharacterized protein FRV6_03297 [Fusarium oxysporum]|uniref:Uncharacterized protein n=1 Tax=Fusarium oxysporum TaxID=5507 RepID=A0A2H3T350_FUSOX|nr:uncharacterized protein FRV6_03297 [Fusarium oxysporum]
MKFDVVLPPRVRYSPEDGSDLQMPLFLVYERSLCRLVSSAATLSIPVMEYR